ncbi:MAG: hypothetical protein JWN30_1140 [Bacilli bacterium]|nr:hypothetical protein [Bacilli bacterium]
MIVANQIRPYLGKGVVCHSRHGIHTGILQEIRVDGIVLRNVRIVPANTQVNEELKTVHADQPEELNIQEAFWPFFFIPFLALFAVALAAAAYPWYGYWYGYPYY